MEETPPHLSLNPNPQFNFTTHSYFMERGPRYEAYSKLRQSRLGLRSMIREEDPVPESEIPKPSFSPSPVKKSVKFQVQDGFPGQKRTVLKPSSKSSSSSSMVAQSVPDLMSALRKENRRPPPGNRIEKSATPPPAKNPKLYGSGSKGGSKSVNSGEKKAGGNGRSLMGERKSYASMEELKGFSAAAALAIAGENRGGRGRAQRVVGKASVLGVRQSVQFY